MTVEAVAAIGAVVTTGSLVLLAFGFDSVIVPAFNEEPFADHWFEKQFRN